MYKQKTLFGITIALIAIVMGTALAAWTESLLVNVTVNTGKVDVSIISQGTYFRDNEKLGEDYGTCSVSISSDGNSATVTINNAYPGYKAEVYLKVKNVGTIPVKLDGWSSTHDPNALSVDLHNPDSDPDDPSAVIDPSAVTNPGPKVINPGGTHTYKLSIEVLDGAAPNSKYEFTVTLTFIQWNK